MALTRYTRRTLKNRRGRKRRASRTPVRITRRRIRRPIPFYSNHLSRKSVRTVLVYHDQKSLNPLTADGNALVNSTNVWQICANGCYDPDITGAGHQPMYFDNYSQVYQRYRVDYSVITATVVNFDTPYIGGTNAYRFLVSIDPTPGVTSQFSGNINSMIEQNSPGNKWRFLSPSVNGKLPRIRMGCKPSAWINRSPKDDQLSSDTGNNPPAPVYYYLCIAAADQDVDAPGVKVAITVKYYITFFDRQNVQSLN